MDIIEILERPSPAHYTVEELQFAVSEYIFQKKNIRVDVNIYKNINISKITPQEFFQLDIQHEMLMHAFEIVQRKYDKTKL